MALAISQSVWQTAWDSTTVSESYNNCIAIRLLLATGLPGDHSPVAVCHRRSMYFRRCCPLPVLTSSLPRSATTPRIYVRFITITQPPALWLTYPGRFTVSRKMPLTVNRKVRPEGKRKDRRRVGSGVDPRGDGCDCPLATGQLTATMLSIAITVRFSQRTSARARSRHCRVTIPCRRHSAGSGVVDTSTLHALANDFLPD